MTKSVSPNRDRLIRTARMLRPLLDEVVFVGGQVAELLVTEPAAVAIRETNDVDVIVRVTTRAAWHSLERRLDEMRFPSDISEGAPICRRRSRDGLILDVMPLDESILGFSNRWYPYALESAWSYLLAPTLAINVIGAPAFLATK